MKILFPIFLLISLIIIICILIELYNIIKIKYKIDKEAFQEVNLLKRNRKSFSRNNINYYDGLSLDKNYGDILTRLNNSKMLKFPYLTVDGELVEGFEENILKQVTK